MLSNFDSMSKSKQNKFFKSQLNIAKRTSKINIQSFQVYQYYRNRYENIDHGCKKNNIEGI